MSLFKQAKRHQKKGKVALIGPSGSGKTLSALLIARGLVGEEGRIALLDSERGSGAIYAPDVPGGYLQADLSDRAYETYIAGINAAAKEGIDCLIIDSISHAWEEFLAQHELEAQRQRNSFTAWAKITPRYQALIDAVVSAPLHVIATMRAKSDYVMEERNGKQVPKKVGLAPIMRPGSEYEFDLVGTLDLDHNLAIEKTRAKQFDGRITPKAGIKFGEELRAWLESGEPRAQPTPTPPTAAPAPHRLDAPPDDSANGITPEYRYDLSAKLDGKSDEERAKMIAWLNSKGGASIDEGLGVWSFPQEIKALREYEVRA